VAEARAADIDARRAAVRGDAGAGARAAPLKRCALRPRFDAKLFTLPSSSLAKYSGFSEDAWAAEPGLPLADM